MRRLGDVLELLHTADDRWATLRADGRAWRHGSRSLEAFLRGIPESARSRVLSRAEPRPQPLESEESWRLWLAGATKARAEFTVEGEVSVVTRDGRSWWSWSASSGRQTNDGRANMEAGMGPGWDLVGPAGLLELLDLEVVREVRFLDRDAILARGVPAEALDPREDSRVGAPGLGAGADDYLFHVDAERGVLLRSEARLHGLPFQLVEVRSVAFDEAFGPDIFDPPGPATEELFSLEEARPLPIEDLAEAVDFTVWLPRHVRADAAIDATIHPAIPRHGVPAAVRIAYNTFDPDETEPFWLSLMESNESMPAPAEVTWRRHGELRVGSRDRTGRVRVRLVRAGTHVELTADGLSEQGLIELARSMEPVPEGAPPLERRPP